MNVYVMDFETYYSKDYSLSKMSTEEYIRNPQFEPIMVGIKRNEEPTYTVVGKDIKPHLESIREDIEQSAIVFHHAHFDGLILSHYYGLVPRIYFDTLSMARAVHGVSVGGSLAKLAAHYELGAKGTAVHDMLGKHLSDVSPSEIADYRRYCRDDVDLTHGLFYKLLPHYTKMELKVIDIIVRMFTAPELVVNEELAEKWVEEIRANKARLMVECGVSKDDLMSNERFAKVLGELLAEYGLRVPMKTSPTTGRQTYAFAKTDEQFTALASHEDVRIQALVAARLGNKTTINETRAAKLQGIGSRGAAPIYIKYAGAAQTMRTSGGDGMNWQNLGKTKSPKEGDETRLVMTDAGWGEFEGMDGEMRHTTVGAFNKESVVHLVGLRDLIEAQPGHVLVVVDSSNIEARVLAALAGEKEAVQRFRQGVDPYCHMASKIYGRHITKADKAARMIGKVCVLGLGYGMGHQKFQDTVKAWGAGDIDIVMAKAVVDTYRSTYTKVVQLWQRADSGLPFIASGAQYAIDPNGLLVTEKGRIILPNRLAIRYPDLRFRPQEGWEFWNGLMKGKGQDKEKIFSKVYGGLMVENITQALARIIVTEQMVEVNKVYPVKWFIHDEIVLHVPEAEAQTALDFAVKTMQASPSWWPEVPLDAEGSFHYTYGMAK